MRKRSASLVVGVGKDVKPFSRGRRTVPGSRYNCPLCIIPKAGKSGEDPLNSSNKEHWAVLNDDVARSNLPNNALVLKPERAAGAVQPGCAVLIATAEVLAGEAPGKHVDLIPVGKAVESSYIVVLCSVWEVLGKALAGFGQDFHLEGVLPAHPLSG